MIRFAFAALMALCILPTAAYAADTTVDLTILTGNVLELVLTGLSAVALWLVRKGIDALRERTGLELDDQLKSRIDDALFQALQYGKSKVLTALQEQTLTVDVRNEVVKHAIDYAQASVPGALDYFDISPARLVDMLEARLGLDLDLDGDIAGRAA
ncbi:inadl protein [Roseibium salinum]|uniref:Inadl protein n=1 Tax=Roseibium salinum TaxID=1604349 RepID=A0ABT3R084_9HYPH|nr:inadl protein [Roseibium sp. DSM 29163]MCX2722629.1 inadl protein [Roseibium sp. DSM 29163]MDN3719406.1 inadl protein [Roseibium salinum]